MDSFVGFLDNVLGQIEEQIARFEPERGGALLGPVGQPLVTEFIYDRSARTSGSTYTPSRWLAEQVTVRERADQNLELKGILHSHPSGISRPSQGDHFAYADSLEGAPWLGRLVAPIITIGGRPRGPHEVALPSGVMSVYVAERRLDITPGVALKPAAPHVVPVFGDLGRVATVLGGKASTASATDVDGQLYLAGLVACDGLDLHVLVGPHYPFTAPIVIVSRHAKETGAQPPESQALPLRWDLAVPDETRLLVALLGDGGVGQFAAEKLLSGTADDQVTDDAEPVGEIREDMDLKTHDEPNGDAEPGFEIEASVDLGSDGQPGGEAESGHGIEQSVDLGSQDEPDGGTGRGVDAESDGAQPLEEEAEPDGRPPRKEGTRTDPTPRMRWHVRLGQWLSRVKPPIHPRHWHLGRRLRPSALPAAASDSEANADSETVSDDVPATVNPATVSAALESAATANEDDSTPASGTECALAAVEESDV